MSARHRCRNQHCRLKLKAPVENEHHAFCCHGCFDRFYLKRCRVCERDIASNPITGERRKRLSKRHYCGRKCKQEAARFPRVYAWGVPEAGKSPVSSRSAHSTHTFFGLAGHRPKAHCLRDWWWGDPDIGDCSLYDAEGLTRARIVLQDGRWHLRSPRAMPRQSWDSQEVAEHGAKNFALMAIPLAEIDPKLAARIKRDNETPHPMGPPLNRAWPINSDDAVRLGASSRLDVVGFVLARGRSGHEAYNREEHGLGLFPTAATAAIAVFAAAQNEAGGHLPESSRSIPRRGRHRANRHPHPRRRPRLKAELIDPDQAVEALADCDCLQLISPQEFHE
jgi:hypothetical protein